MLYQGSEDDLFAVRFGLQLAKNETVDLKILSVRAVDGDSDEIDGVGKETGFRKTNSDCEFETLRASIPGSIARRVSIVDLSLSGIEAVSKAISEPSAAETILLIGRSMAHTTFTLASHAIVLGGSSRDETRALGPLATSVIKFVREKRLNTGLLVLQARRHVDEAADAGGPGAGPLKGMPTLTKKLSALSDD